MSPSTGAEMDMSSTSTTASASASSTATTMTMSHMDMTFFASQTTPLYSSSWSPDSPATYALTCIFLLLLAVILRALSAYKARCEARWLHNSLKRRYIVTLDTNGEEGKSRGFRDREAGQEGEAEGKGLRTAVLSVNGVEENVRVVERRDLLGRRRPTPWRLSVDLPRACLVAVMVGLGYLLMLAVMTMNVGYFLSIVAGAFVGELFLGRYSADAGMQH